MPSKTSKQPLFNFSLTKLSLGVIVSAIVTLGLFALEHRQTIEKEVATRVIPFPITLIIASDSATPNITSVQAMYGDTPLTYKPNITPPLGKTWNCYVNNQPVPIPPDRFALHPKDELTWKLETVK